MAQRALSWFLCASGVLQRVLTADIQTQHTVMAAEGEEASLSCCLMQTSYIIQVTWQKISPEGKKNVATYNEFFGQTVNAAFRDKVEFKESGLQNSSIVIRKVSQQDEGCYHCLFNIYPDGAITGSTCLQLYELHEPVLRVGESDRAEELLLSCWATGRPAPTVTLHVLHQHLQLSNHSSVSVANGNGTATVTATAVLPGGRHNCSRVGCAARVLSGPQIEVFVTVPEVKQSPADGGKRFQSCRVIDCYDFTFTVMLAVVVACVCVAAVISVLLLREHRKSLSHRDSERNETPLKPSEDTHESRTPVVHHVNEQLRQRSTGKLGKSNIPQASSVKKKCRRQLF